MQKTENSIAKASSAKKSGTENDEVSEPRDNGTENQAGGLKSTETSVPDTNAENPVVENSKAPSTTKRKASPKKSKPEKDESGSIPKMTPEALTAAAKDAFLDTASEGKLLLLLLSLLILFLFLSLLSHLWSIAYRHSCHILENSCVIHNMDLLRSFNWKFRSRLCVSISIDFCKWELRSDFSARILIDFWRLHRIQLTLYFSSKDLISPCIMNCFISSLLLLNRNGVSHFNWAAL